MSEERSPHPQEPAEGAEKDIGGQGADKARDDRGTAQTPADETRSSQHPQEPAEGGSDDVEAPSADRARDVD